MRLCRLFAATFAAVLLLAGSASAQVGTVWHVPGDFPTIQAAIDDASVAGGDTIVVAAGSHAGATVTKAVTIRGEGRATIVDGPVVSPFGRAGFYFPTDGGGSGATITGLYFDRVELPVFSRGADDVSVTRNTMTRFVQGVTNWGYGEWGNRWEIADNILLGMYTSCGGGIGIMVGDFMGATMIDNVIARNTIRGPVLVPKGDCGGYNAPGILLFADFRLPVGLGALIYLNRVEENQVRLQGGARLPGPPPGFVNVSGIELSDTRNVPTALAIVKNDIVYNDLGAMPVPFSFTPDELELVNTIDNNLTTISRFLPNRLRTSARTARPGPAPVR